jgi:hypothetical protein
MKRMDRIQTELEAIRGKHRGRLTPLAVVDAARSKSHPLHKEFEWDDKKAAHRQRLDRARELISYIVVVTIDKTVRMKAPYYIHDPSLPANQSGYCLLTADSITAKDAQQFLLSEIARVEDIIGRSRGAVSVLEKKFPGLNKQLERALQQIVAVGARVSKKARASARRVGRGRESPASPPLM